MMLPFEHLPDVWKMHLDTMLVFISLEGQVTEFTSRSQFLYCFVGVRGYSEHGTSKLTVKIQR